MVWKRLARRRRREPLIRHTVILYGKPGCHLCDDARRHLERLRDTYPFELEEVDITRDPSLFRKYDIFIPVITIDGKQELMAPISETELEGCLKRI